MIRRCWMKRWRWGTRSLTLLMSPLTCILTVERFICMMHRAFQWHAHTHMYHTAGTKQYTHKHNKDWDRWCSVQHAMEHNAWSERQFQYSAKILYSLSVCMQWHITLVNRLHSIILQDGLILCTTYVHNMRSSSQTIKFQAIYEVTSNKYS